MLANATFQLYLPSGASCTAFNLKHNGKIKTITAGHCCESVPNKLLLYTSLQPDLCIFKDAVLKTKSFITLSQIAPKVSDKVYSVGYPKGFGPLQYEGRISDIIDRGVIVSINFLPGQSGSALVDEWGRLLSIFSMYYIYVPEAGLVPDFNLVSKEIKKAFK